MTMITIFGRKATIKHGSGSFRIGPYYVLVLENDDGTWGWGVSCDGGPFGKNEPVSSPQEVARKVEASVRQHFLDNKLCLLEELQQVAIWSLKSESTKGPQSSQE